MDSMTPSVEAQEQHGSDAEGNTRSALAVRALTNDTNPIRISSMVDLRDVCRLRLLCRATKEDYGRRARKACLTRGAGVPEDRRIQFWQFMLNVEKEMAEKSAGEQKRSASDLYKSCLHGATRGQVTDSPEKGDPESGSSAFNAAHTDGVTSLPSGRRALSNSGAEGEISRDVGRTFPQLSMFNDPNGPGQNMLANVLRACLNSNPDIGYCQGMNFVAGALLLAYTVRDPSITSLPRKPRTNPPGFESGVHDPASRGERTSRSELGETESSGHGSEREDVDDDGIDNDDYDDDEVVVLLRGAGHEGVVVDNEGDGDGEDDAPREWRSGPQHEKAEEDVFWMMLALSTRLPDVGAGLGMRELWLPGVPQLKVRVFQFDKLLLQELPRLYNHFKAKQLQLEVLVSQWFLTLFSYSLRPPLLMRVLDLTFMDGWKAMFRFGLARLRSVEATLCELEIEGVSRFLRGYREEDAPPSPLLRSMLQDAGDTSIPCGGGIRQASSESAASAAVGVGSSSQQVLRAAWKIKVTRKTLDRLQQDFAVQLLREHLEGQGQWLTRYGDAPEPNPGAGAGVVGGGADGDVGFMGVEAMTRMMLSDSKLLARLKEELDGMAAPVQSDAQIFQTKITEASERQEEATRERSTLAAELFRLKEDIEALGERKKLITEQMHQLLVEFEKDSARMKIEEARKRERARRASALGAEEVAAGDEGRGRTRGMKPEKDAGGHGDGGPRLISVETRMTQKTLPNSPAPEESPAGSEAVQERTAGRKACTDSPSHSKTSSNDDCSDGVESDDELPRSMSGPVSSPVSPSRSSSPASPPLRINPDGMLRMWKPVEGSPPAETSTSWRTGSPIFRPRFPRLSSFTSIPSVLPRDEADEEEDGGREGFVFLRRLKQGGEERVARDGKGAGPFQDDARGVERSTTPQGAVELGGESFLTQMGAEGAWEKLAKWARPTSTWFKSGALRRSRVLGGSLSPPRGSSRGENQGELTPMEELYEDLKKFRRKLEEVQASIDAKTDTYAALQNRYSKAVVEAEEAMELKRALSSQMLHLLLEQERRVDGHLRDCISFTNASGSDGLSSDLLNYFSRAGLSSAGREGCSPADATAAGTTAVAATTEEEDSGRAAEHDGDDTKKRARTVTGKTFDENESIPAALVMSRDHSGDKERCNPREGPAAGTTEEEDVGEESETNDGFEKVEGWMAQDSVDDGCGPDGGDGDGDGDDGGDDGEKGTPDVRN